jgi:hypothetical protein
VRSLGSFVYAGGGSVNLLPLRTPRYATVLQSDTYDLVNDGCGPNLGTVASTRLRRARTNDASFLEILEAPPGFEPGMEVLQIQRGRASCCLVLVSGPSSSPVLPGVRAILDYVRTTAAGYPSPAIVSPPGA